VNHQQAKGRNACGNRAFIAWAPAVWIFPLLIGIVVVVFGALEISGSSASLYGRPATPGVVAGRARDIRTDEWWVRSPLLARQATLGLPERSEVGVGAHDMALLPDLPVRAWDAVLKPHMLAYQVLGFERAFAFDWWLGFFALPALGMYALALQLGVRVLTAALVSLIVALSPFVQWWTGPWTATIGYVAAAGAALIGATRMRSRVLQILVGALAGWLGACGVVVLYPSTLLPTVLLVGAAAVAVIAHLFPPAEWRRQWWLRIGVAIGAACAVAGVLLVGYFVAHRGALDALSNSVYPGRRRSGGGSGHLDVLLSAPFDLIESTRSAVQVTVNGLNQSEASASLFTIPAVLAAVLLSRGRHPLRPWRDRVVLLSILGVSLLLFVWYLLPVPEGLAHLVQFDRVRPDRLLLPFAMASALALGLYFDEQHRSTHRRYLAVAAGTIAFAVPTLWAGLHLTIDGQHAARWQVLLLAAVSTLGIALALRGRMVGLWLLVGLFAVSAATVNPLQHGLGALLESPSARLGRELRARSGTGSVLEFWDGNILTRGGLTASGVDLVSGFNPYPDVKAWRVLDPTDASRHAWDSYNNAVWSPGPPGSAPQISGSGDTVAVTVDPCDPRLGRLGVRTIVSQQPLSDACLVEIDRVDGADGPLIAYRIDRSSGG
jgi:hypothetical protein